MSYDPEKMKILDDLKRKIELNKSSLKETAEKTYKLEKAKIAGFKNTVEIDQALANYHNLEARLKDELAVMEKDYKDAKKLLEPYKDSMIICESTIYPGVELAFGDIEMKVQNREINRVVLKLLNNEIKEYGFNYKEMPKLNID
jgi:uncharacterized protein (DUF342 family)